MKAKLILSAILSLIFSTSLLQSTPLKRKIYELKAKEAYNTANHRFSQQLTTLNEWSFKNYQKDCLKQAIDSKQFNNIPTKVLMKIIEVRLNDLEKNPGLKHHRFHLSAGENIPIKHLQVYLRGLERINNAKAPDVSQSING